MPERNVLPKPVQKPHPPMWVTVTSPGTECDAADRGLGCLGVAAAGYEEQERRTAEYFRRIEQCDPVGGMVDPRGHHFELPLLSRGRRDGGHAWAWAWSAVSGSPNSHLLWTREAYPTRGLPVARQPRAREQATRSSGGPGDAYGIPEGICVGDPDIIGAAIERWESVGVTGINFLLNALESVPQAAGARQHAPLRRRGHAAVRIALMLTGSALRSTSSSPTPRRWPASTPTR